MTSITQHPTCQEQRSTLVPYTALSFQRNSELGNMESFFHGTFAIVAEPAFYVSWAWLCLPCPLGLSQHHCLRICRAFVPRAGESHRIASAQARLSVATECGRGVLTWALWLISATVPHTGCRAPRKSDKDLKGSGKALASKQCFVTRGDAFQDVV